MGNRKSGRYAVAAAALLCAATGLRAAECRQDAVFLRGDWGQARFTVELADDATERAQGLMHRTEMPSAAGMLFVYEAAHSATFWMRNTLIPLDMLFIDSNGVVQHIHHQAKPLDETTIPGGDGVLAVLEINGGMARRMGIQVGSQLRHPAFSNNDPAWPC